jgi:uncharacterized membrane protein HdeD (DUF308 family)
MNKVLRNTLAVIAGILIGMTVNMAFVMLSPMVIPPPPGVDMSDMESLKEHLHLFEPRHYLMPFLAHALGTLTGACAAAFFAVSSQRVYAFVIGAFFMAGGIANVFLLPGPTWFNTTDIAGAYLPFAWLGWYLANKINH